MVKAAVVAAIVLLGLTAPRPAAAYSVLAHEANIDALWDGTIAPMLLARFPEVSGEQIQEARGYAYGGCVIQDLGYYPFGSRFFSNLLHYVRTGDFIVALIRDAQNVDEYAFALGALGHYAADNDGHPMAVNRAVPMMYPKLRKKFGNRVTYAPRWCSPSSRCISSASAPTSCRSEGSRSRSGRWWMRPSWSSRTRTRSWRCGKTPDRRGTTRKS
jgi:hypothetical protein